MLAGMPRTLNVVEHRVRKEAFLDVAQHLIITKGYEAMSIQDVLDAVEASRGAFYHYFESKQALLEAVVDRFADQAMVAVDEVMADRRLPALRKLERVFGRIASFKAEQKPLVLAIMAVWNSDSNAIVREKVRHISASKLGPILTAVLEQGVAEGIVHVESPADTSTVLVSMMLGYQQIAADHFVGRQAGTITWETVMDTYRAHTQAFERILGLDAGSITLQDESVMRFWFG